jgi:hypothetical protein
MLQRTNKVLIGKDISREGRINAGDELNIGYTPVDGEILVLDKYFRVLGQTATIADSDIIYICQGTADEFDGVLEDKVTGFSGTKCLFSDPIEGKLVKKVTATPYDAKSEQTDSYNLTGLTPSAGTEYFVRIVYKDMNEHPGQFTQTYRVIATDNTLATLVVALNGKINAHSGRRVNSTTNNTTTLVLTGRAIPDCTSSLTNIDVFKMVEFESFINYIDANGYWVEVPMTSKTVVPADYGSGTWELVRDLEKLALPYRGIHNFTLFPVQLPTVDTVKSKTYDLIVIEHDKSYVSPDNQYMKQAPLTTVLALEIYSTGDQSLDIVNTLDSWFGSIGTLSYTPISGTFNTATTTVGPTTTN